MTKLGGGGLLLVGLMIRTTKDLGPIKSNLQSSNLPSSVELTPKISVLSSRNLQSVPLPQTGIN